VSALDTSAPSLGAQDDRPLTEQELQQMQRMLSDPFSFPLAFKTWLVAYLSASDLTLTMGSVLGLTNLLGIAGVGGGTVGILPAGIILPFGGDVAPLGTLMCDGASYLRSDQGRLFTAIGTKYGAADSTHFNVPDGQGRDLVGLGPHPEVNTLGMGEGLAPAARKRKHKHQVVTTPHAHGMTGHRTVWGGESGTGVAGIPGFDVASFNDFAIWAGSGGNVNTIKSRLADVGTDAANAAVTVGPSDGAQDASPFVVVNFIIIA
jgi:microcystin-dependent protein